MVSFDRVAQAAADVAAVHEGALQGCMELQVIVNYIYIYYSHRYTALQYLKIFFFEDKKNLCAYFFFLSW